MTERSENALGVGLGTGTGKPGGGPRPKGQRVVLSPPLRRDVADLHAQRVWAEHLAPYWRQANLHQMADLLTLRGVPTLRPGGWNAQRVHHLMQRARRTAKGGASY